MAHAAIEAPPPQSAPTTTGWYTEYEEIKLEVSGLHRPNTVAFHVTLRIILARLPDRPGLKILDVGGGAGPYSLALAERGLSVTLVDTSADLLALAEARAESMPALARILHGDAARLSNHPDLAGEHGTFDAVLLLSPLMSISSSDLCAAALRDAWDFVCPHGGVLFCAWASRLAYYRRLALADPVQLARDQDEDYASRSGGKAWHVRHYEVPENMPGILREATGMEDVEMVGAEGVLAGGLDRMVNELEGQELEAWVQKCLEIGADEHGWRMADHIVGIAMKLVDSTGR